MFANLTYAPLGASETAPAGEIVYAILTNRRIMEMVHEFHGVNMRCAIIIVLEKSQILEVSVREKEQITKRFPQEEIRDALSSYDLDNHVCLILVRDDKVCEVVAGHKASLAS